MLKENTLNTFKRGDLVQWSYTHNLNKNSSIRITKVGVFIRNVCHEVGAGQDVVVHFNGNKNPSKVPLKELRFS